MWVGWQVDSEAKVIEMGNKRAGEVLVQAVQRFCGCPISLGIQGQVDGALGSLIW